MGNNELEEPLLLSQQSAPQLTETIAAPEATLADETTPVLTVPVPAPAGSGVVGPATVPVPVYSLAQEEEEIDDSKDIVFRLGSCCGSSNLLPARYRVIRLNHNVLLNLLLCVVNGASDSLWGGTVIVAYIKKLGRDRNTVVGNIEAAQGLANLISALPVGFLADKVGRDKVLTAGAMLLITTAILHFALLEWIGVDENYIYKHEGPTAFWLLGVVMALWGIAGGIVNGPTQALYADSIVEGERSTYYLYLFACKMVSSCLGPLISIVLFQTLGDEWDLYHLRVIIYVGLGLEISNAFIMMLFDDKKALKEGGQQQRHEEEESQLLLHNDQEQQHNRQHMNEAAESANISATSEDTKANTTTGSETAEENGDANESPAVLPISPEESTTTTVAAPCINTLDQNDPYQCYRWAIPYIIFAQSIVFSVASGMTVKFFPLYFKDEVGMSPIQVQIIYVLVPIGIVICSIHVKKLSAAGLGRPLAMVFARIIGIGLLFSMVYGKPYLKRHPFFVLVPIFVLGAGAMDGVYPLRESMLMDFVDPKERARWKSLDSVTVFGWCGSAALGGYISDQHDYTYTFLITALMQSVGLLISCLLIPLVPRKEGSSTGR